jgi:hypothetical protein
MTTMTAIAVATSSHRRGRRSPAARGAAGPLAGTCHGLGANGWPTPHGCDGVWSKGGRETDPSPSCGAHGGESTPCQASCSGAGGTPGVPEWPTGPATYHCGAPVGAPVAGPNSAVWRPHRAQNASPSPTAWPQHAQYTYGRRPTPARMADLAESEHHARPPRSASALKRVEWDLTPFGDPRNSRLKGTSVRSDAVRRVTCRDSSVSKRRRSVTMLV